MGASIKNSDDYGPVAEINITPFVDVMLVLLVIFMVAAPLMENGIPIQLPRATAKALKHAQEPVVLHITRERVFYLNKSKISAAELIKSLQGYYKNRPSKEIFVRADGKLPYEFVAQTMAAIKLAGIDKIGLVTLPPDKKGE
ncbi:MAG: ExbD/TolR family protein [Bdellovibrionaceae bacterium]|nr:ExbD/TolR family protein [Bdellovibrionales bacterium]MCB9253145.1 ExbD/TolR family protein [Pseudobdellovibrionaceae bacterium]